MINKLLYFTRKVNYCFNRANALYQLISLLKRVICLVNQVIYGPKNRQGGGLIDFWGTLVWMCQNLKAYTQIQLRIVRGVRWKGSLFILMRAFGDMDQNKIDFTCLKQEFTLIRRTNAEKCVFWRIPSKNQKFDLRFEVLESFQVRPEPIHGSPGPYTLKKKFQKIFDFDFPCLELWFICLNL